MSVNADGQEPPCPEDQNQFDEISLNMAPVHPMSYVLSPPDDAILSSSSAEESPAMGTSPIGTVPPETLSERNDQQPKPTQQSEETTDPAKDNAIPTTLTTPPERDPPQAQQMPSAQQCPSPPIYTAIYPPGTHPATPSEQIPQYANCSPTYIIDTGAIRNGNGTELSPKLLVHGTTGVLKSAHLVTPPVLILADPFGELARRRKNLALFSLLFLFFPMVTFLLIVLSMRGMNSHQLF